MGKRQKKREKGEASAYISRTRAVRKLQVSLADFRRLCILKGVYPREPKDKKRVNKGSTAPRTFYSVKDIAFLAHEPLLQKFREFKVFARKLRKALAKKQVSIADSLRENKPVLTLDHLIKERYPTFVDAVHDLDDALCMLVLFSRMPKVGQIAPAFIASCSRLTAEFLNYIVVTHSLRKVFLSIKGIYYQADIYGQPVTWIEPYSFTPQVPREVDFRVMRTFLELYETLLGFVNYKLYTDEQLMYPPALDSGKDAAAAGLSAFVMQYKDEGVSLAEALDLSIASTARPDAVRRKKTASRIKSLKGKLSQLAEADGDNADDAAHQEEDAGEADADAMDIDEFPPNEAAAEDAGAAPGADATAEDLGVFSTLFKDCRFFLSREVPRESLDFVIRAFGGTVGWADEETSPFGEDDERITHQIVDRPSFVGKHTTRDYIQPQWVYDCVNARRLLPIGPYAPGAKLPPHLSPFVVTKEGEYDPLDERFLGTDEPRRAGGDDEDDVDDDQGAEGEGAEDDEDDQEEDDQEEDDEEEEDDDDEDDDEDDEERRYQKELEAEARGMSFSEFTRKRGGDKPLPSAAERKRRREQEEEKEERELAVAMMKKKERNLYRKIQHSRQKQQAAVQTLQERKKALVAKETAAAPAKKKRRDA